jgi:hypothetical protein
MMTEPVPLYSALTRHCWILVSKRFGRLDHLISNLIASRAQPDTAFPTEAVAGR